MLAQGIMNDAHAITQSCRVDCAHPSFGINDVNKIVLCLAFKPGGFGARDKQREFSAKYLLKEARGKTKCNFQIALKNSLWEATRCLSKNALITF